jgi:hypothetical protein
MAAAAVAGPVVAPASTREDNICKQLIRDIGALGIMQNPPTVNRALLTQARNLIESVRTTIIPNVGGQYDQAVQNMVTIDDQMINELYDPNNGVSPQDRVTLENLVKELLLNQLYVLVMIICKPVKTKLPPIILTILEKIRSLNALKNAHTTDLEASRELEFFQTGGNLSLKKKEYKVYKHIYEIHRNKNHY